MIKRVCALQQQANYKSVPQMGVRECVVNILFIYFLNIFVVWKSALKKYYNYDLQIANICNYFSV